MRIKLFIPVAAAAAALCLAPQAHAQVTFSFSANPISDPLPSGTTASLAGGVWSIKTQPDAAFDVYATVTNNSGANVYLLADDLAGLGTSFGTPTLGTGPLFGVPPANEVDWLNGGTASLLASGASYSYLVFNDSIDPTAAAGSSATGSDFVAYAEGPAADSPDIASTNTVDYTIEIPAKSAPVPEFSSAAGFGVGLLLLAAGYRVRRRIGAR